jgi:Protein of unknown function (DUF1826)
VIAPRHAVDTLALLNSTAARNAQLTPEQHDSLVLTIPNELLHLQAGDVAFLCGARPDRTASGTASIHRSPRTSTRTRRLVIQIDDVV